MENIALFRNVEKTDALLWIPSCHIADGVLTYDIKLNWMSAGFTFFYLFFCMNCESLLVHILSAKMKVFGFKGCPAVSLRPSQFEDLTNRHQHRARGVSHKLWTASSSEEASLFIGILNSVQNKSDCFRCSIPLLLFFSLSDAHQCIAVLVFPGQWIRCSAPWAYTELSLWATGEALKPNDSYELKQSIIFATWRLFLHWNRFFCGKTFLSYISISKLSLHVFARKQKKNDKRMR